MFNEVKDIYSAKLELMKLQGVDMAYKDQDMCLAV
jgi:hypothetical protein